MTSFLDDLKGKNIHVNGVRVPTRKNLKFTGPVSSVDSPSTDSTTVDVEAPGEAPEDGKTYGRKDGAWEEVASTAPVDSVFGRTGAVAAAASDYDASQVDNDSGVSGATVADALDTLDASIPTPATNKFWDPDYPPASANAADDEFDGTSLDGKWGRWVPGSPVQSETVGNGDLTIDRAAHTGGVALSGIYQAAPALDFTMYAKLCPQFYWSGTSGNQLQFGIFIADDIDTNPATARVCQATMVLGGGGAATGNSLAAIGPRANYNASISFTNTRGIPDGSAYLRASVDSTNMRLDVSMDGCTWIRVTQKAHLISSVEYIGIAVSNRTTSSDIALRVPFFRVVNGFSNIADRVDGAEILR